MFIKKLSAGDGEKCDCSLRECYQIMIFSFEPHIIEFLIGKPCRRQGLRPGGAGQLLSNAGWASGTGLRGLQSLKPVWTVGQQPRQAREGQNCKSAANYVLKTKRTEPTAAQGAWLHLLSILPVSHHKPSWLPQQCFFQPISHSVRLVSTYRSL